MLKKDTAKPLRIMVVEDNEAVRKQICALLTRHPEFEVISEAENGLEAVRQAEKLKPDVVVLDISMPILGGIEASAKIRRVAPKARIVFLSQHESGRVAQTALATGALAYVVKSAATRDLVLAVQAAAQGKTFLSQLK